MGSSKRKKKQLTSSIPKQFRSFVCYCTNALLGAKTSMIATMVKFRLQL